MTIPKYTGAINIIIYVNVHRKETADTYGEFIECLFLIIQLICYLKSSWEGVYWKNVIGTFQGELESFVSFLKQIRSNQLIWDKN